METPRAPDGAQEQRPGGPPTTSALTAGRCPRSPLLGGLHAHGQRGHGSDGLGLFVLALLGLHQGVAGGGGEPLQGAPVLACGRARLLGYGTGTPRARGRPAASCAEGLKQNPSLATLKQRSLQRQEPGNHLVTNSQRPGLFGKASAWPADPSPPEAGRRGWGAGAQEGPSLGVLWLAGGRFPTPTCSHRDDGGRVCWEGRGVQAASPPSGRLGGMALRPGARGRSRETLASTHPHGQSDDWVTPNTQDKQLCDEGRAGVPAVRRPPGPPGWLGRGLHPVLGLCGPRVSEL